MTQKQALARAQKLYGKNAAVEVRKNGGVVGAHGEFVKSESVMTKGDRAGRYLCRACSTARLEDADTDYVERRVWHRHGSYQVAYRVGRIDLGMFFSCKGEGDSFEAAFAAIKAAQ
jgi:hypothetical protein